MSDQSQQTCSICSKVFEGVLEDPDKHPGVYLGYTPTDSNFEVAGRKCSLCGADVCKNCIPNISGLANLFSGGKKNICPKCKKPSWSVKSYYLYIGAGDLAERYGWLKSYVPFALRHKVEILDYMENNMNQVVELIFAKAIQQNEGEELLNLAKMAEIGWQDPFKDGKIEERLLDAALNHKSDAVKENACLVLIRLEEILRSNAAIPGLLNSMDNSDMTYIDPYIIIAMANSFPALGWRNDVIDICVEALQKLIGYEDRRLLTEKLPTTVGNDKIINEKIVAGLTLALKQRQNEVLQMGSLFSYETPVGAVAAESLSKLGSMAMNAVPGLIQALRQGVIGSNPFTDALCAITGVNFGNSADDWQAWWENKQ
jgi:hypothetical protein